MVIFPDGRTRRSPGAEPLERMQRLHLGQRRVDPDRTILGGVRDTAGRADLEIHASPQQGTISIATIRLRRRLVGRFVLV